MIDVVFVIGPTGIGKTKYAIDFAKANNGEIVSADSMQLYKYLDIGSAKPTQEERAAVKHYLVDEIDPRTPFSVYDYKQLALAYIKQISDSGKLPVVCGGTGLYVNSLVYDMDFDAPEGSMEYRNAIYEAEHGDPIQIHERLKKLDPDAAAIIHPNNVKRTLRAIERLEKGEYKLKAFSESDKPSTLLNCRLLYLNTDRELLYKKINQRVEMLYNMGLEAEVRGLMEMGLTSADVSMKGIGYKEIIEAINEGRTAESAMDLIKQNTRHYAKRQISWFNRYKQAEIIEV